PGGGEDRAVVSTREDDRDARRTVAIDDAPAGVDPPRSELVEHEPAEAVVAHHRGERNAKPQPGRAAGRDGPRPADHEAGLVHELLGLAEGRIDVAPQDEVRVGIPEHEQVELRRHARSLPAPGRPPLGCGPCPASSSFVVASPRSRSTPSSTPPPPRRCAAAGSTGRSTGGAAPRSWRRAGRSAAPATRRVCRPARPSPPPPATCRRGG